MNLKNKWHVAAFLAVFGTLSYFGKVIWEVYYLPVLPLSEGWCLDAKKVVVDVSRYGEKMEWRCIEFRSTLDEFIYYHNVEMRALNQKAITWTIFINGLFGFLVFNTIPKRRKQISRYDNESPIIALVIGFCAAVIVPWLLSWLLPAPEQWLPQSIVEAAQERIDGVLAEVEFVAFLVDTYGFLDRDEFFQLMTENQGDVLAEFEAWRRSNRR